MKVINTGSTYRIYGDDLKVRDKLAADVYIVRFHPMQGFSLAAYNGMEMNEEKVYGVHLSKVNKVVKSFKKFTRNLGVILSGDKGIGKSIFARILSNTLVREGYPVVIVDEFFPGIHTFLESIEQEVVVVFDEFDKTFSVGSGNEEGSTPQSSLLSLLDGTGGGKKLYVVTCNNVYALNDFFVNRPGRFHYHFRFGYPDADGVREYLQDKIDKKHWSQIDKVVEFSASVPLNYDCLRAIAYELQEGEEFVVAIKDLNILNINSKEYDLQFVFASGDVVERRDIHLDMFNPAPDRIGMYHTSSQAEVFVEFKTTNAKHIASRGAHVISTGIISRFGNSSARATAKENPEMNEAIQVKEIIIKPKVEESLHYLL